ncbi:MAG: hypothetical protein EAZ89_19880 [Bacteroidetes bacterium]|jgi:hypothetical protein|nr:MAG: hypothetical protein EAZ89_19880 [Bacteroidota bacterium]
MHGDMKLSWFSSALVLLIMASPVLSLGQITKEEERFWKDKAKMYSKNPESLKAEFENYQEQIKELKRINKELMAKAASSQNSDLVDSLRWVLIQMEGELQAQRSQKEKLEKAYKSQAKVSEMGIKPGLVYRIQIGAYVFYEIANKPKDADDIVEEKADGFNKYVIGGFRTYDEAISFRDEVRKMGLKDAWVVPYIDGIRVTVEEANQYLQKQGQTAKMDN